MTRIYDIYAGTENGFTYDKPRRVADAETSEEAMKKALDWFNSGCGAMTIARRNEAANEHEAEWSYSAAWHEERLGLLRARIADPTDKGDTI